MNPIDTTIFKFREKETAAKILGLDSNYQLFIVCWKIF